MYYRMSDLVRGIERFSPDGSGYIVLKIEAQHVIEVTTLIDEIRLNYESILNDWRHRQYGAR